jgi:hypothetical protein
VVGLNSTRFTLVVILLEVGTAVSARVEVAVTLEHAQHRLLLLLAGLLGVVGGKTMQHRPGVVAQFLAAEWAFSLLLVHAEGLPEVGEGVVLADKFLAVLRHSRLL